MASFEDYSSAEDKALEVFVLFNDTDTDNNTMLVWLFCLRFNG